MENVYRNFYRNFYMCTGGFIPAMPLDQNIFPGDFFQVRNGEMILLGNIFRNNVIDAADAGLEYGIKLNPAAWNFSDGVTKPYSGRGVGRGPIEGEFEFSKQELAFSKKGSFFFRSNNPESVKISNWNDLQQQLIIKLTQTQFSFRELYVATECATTSDWTLAIAGSEKGILEIATDSENFGLVDIFGHHTAKTIQSKEIEFYHRESKRKPSFFKAKKLVIQEEKLDVFISELINQHEDQHTWAGSFYDYDFHYDPVYTRHATGNARASVLDMLQANQLNPNTALLYFRWGNANMDDIEKLFLRYGN
ncbi:MAG TPA: hypothetical protein VNY73_04365 [Bacteroidia bacterium]|jgi:hypothetical protein|nr:hypothetical protein [Bacteroidia bacterium]